MNALDLSALALNFDDVLIVPKPSDIKSRKDVSLRRVFKFNNGAEWTGVPIIAANMQNIGTPQVSKILSSYGMLTALNKEYFTGITPIDVFHTYGLKDTVSNWRKICLDVANGYMQNFVEYISEVRMYHPGAIIMAGNVVTPEGTKALVEAGADIVKVGLGSGSACLTREKTGVGYPQLQAVLDCSEVAYNMGAYICSDGGHRTPGDVAKSFVAGADFVMLGGMFAGTDETADELIGNAAGPFPALYKTVEGRRIFVPYKGTLSSVVEDLLGGLRSTCSYVGAHTIEQLGDAQFVLVR